MLPFQRKLRFATTIHTYKYDKRINRLDSIEKSSISSSSISYDSEYYIYRCYVQTSPNSNIIAYLGHPHG